MDHANFYGRFIKDFSKITKPLCDLLEKDAAWDFNEDCLRAFEEIKRLLTSDYMCVGNLFGVHMALLSWVIW